ncbi:MAG TPA: acyltransferase family protein [Actinomycetota bacterium]|nr:acyltransferase family protein [Actinomycetota bacterium]
MSLLEASPGTAARPATGRARYAHRPGLDGLRALAIIGVLLYHAGIRWMPGGFLGVDLFFVISGFLITSLLIAEVERTARISLPDFFRRRARRLLPALGAVLVVTTLALLTFWHRDLGRFKGDVVASMTYLANWWFVIKHQSYFQASGRPSPFQQLWSLGVEEQFYLVWPVVAALVLAGRASVQRLTRLGLVAVFGAVLSTAWMAVLAIHEHVPYGTDASRVYMGTDTHAMGVLLGAGAAALVAAAERRGGRLWGRPERILLLDLAGGIALAGVGASMLLASEFTTGLYRGGFLAFAVLSAVAVVAASQREGGLGLLLGARPLRWIGDRSYSLYIWHWPIFVYTRPQLDVPFGGAADVVFRLALTVAAAEASYRRVEQPARQMGIRAYLRQVAASVQAFGRRLQEASRAEPGPEPGADGAWRPSIRVEQWRPMFNALRLRSIGQEHLRWEHLRWESLRDSRALAVVGRWRPGIALYSACALAALVLGIFVTSGSAPAHAVNRAAGSRAAVTVPRTLVPAPTHSQSVVPAAKAASPAAPAQPAGAGVTAIGDSVMLGAAPQLQAALPGASVNAVEGRQASDAFSLIDSILAEGHLGPTLVLHVGTNGTIDARALGALLDKTGDRTVVLLNVHVPRDWQGSDNTILAEAAHARPNVVFIDWNAIASAHPQWFWSDGIHLRPAGAQAYAELISAALQPGT